MPQLEIKVAEIFEKCKEVNKITGAYVLIKKLKDRFKTFDTALEIMSQSKTSVDDFRKLETKVKENQPLAIF